MIRVDAWTCLRVRHSRHLVLVVTPPMWKTNHAPSQFITNDDRHNDLPSARFHSHLVSGSNPPDGRVVGVHQERAKFRPLGQGWEIVHPGITGADLPSAH